MPSIKSDILPKVAQSILDFFSQLSTEELQKILQFEDYHGFEKSRLPDNIIKRYLKAFRYTPAKLQIEVIKVTKDLSDQIHYHKNSTAYIYILGTKHHFQSPYKGKFYYKSNWIKVVENEHWLIFPTEHHGFTVDRSGSLYFLSIQTPPIVNGVDDDYYQVRNIQRNICTAYQQCFIREDEEGFR